jgi:16S rRNA (cytosine967-C5)-methyltransferase
VYNVLRNKNFYTDFSEAGRRPDHAPPDLLGMSDAVGLESLGC